MPSATTVSIVYAILSVVVATAWVLGYLDKYQRKAQDAALAVMGENRASFGLKHAVNQDVTGDEDVKGVQKKLGEAATAPVSKGGFGQDIGDTLSKGL